MAMPMPPIQQPFLDSQPPPPPPTQQPEQSSQPQDDFTMPNTDYVPPQPPPNYHPPLISTASYPEQSNVNDSGYPSADDLAGDTFAFKAPDSLYFKITRSINQRYQVILDASTPHWAARWTFSLVLLLIFMARIILAQGWYIICYGLSIYYLNLFIGFLSPKIDPAFKEGGEFDFDDLGDSDVGPMLPTNANDEFRPFIRRLPEFKFWLSATKATLISLFLTLFEIFDLPVFWPILLLYFILLFVSTMRQQIRHMIKYGYVPWDKGKKRYGVQKNEPSDSFSTTI